MPTGPGAADTTVATSSDVSTSLDVTTNPDGPTTDAPITPSPVGDCCSCFRKDLYLGLFIATFILFGISLVICVGFILCYYYEKLPSTWSKRVSQWFPWLLTKSEGENLFHARREVGGSLANWLEF